MRTCDPDPNSQASAQTINIASQIVILCVYFRMSDVEKMEAKNKQNQIAGIE